jgi:RIO kinase 1
VRPDLELSMPIFPDWLAPVIQPLLDAELVVELYEPIKSGKEATVYRCRAHPRSGHEELALKVYREHRSFRNDATYREGTMLTRIGGGNTRQARAVRNGSHFGRAVGEHAWCGREWEVLCTLHAAGLPVPAPVHLASNAILMELFTRGDGSVAPPLASAELSGAAGHRLFESICDDVERMLALHVVHGDLSPYNILWADESYRIIDLPQAVDPRFNSNAQRLLARDVENLARFCGVTDARDIAADMWLRFERGET